MTGLTVILTDEVSGGLYKASGDFVGQNHRGEEIGVSFQGLVQKTNKEYALVLDSGIAPSLLDGKPILKYTDAQPVVCNKAVKPGLTVHFTDFHVTIQNKK